MRPRLRRLLPLVLLGSAALPVAAAQGAGVLALNGGPEPAAIAVFVDPDTGELVIRDPAGIEAPGDPCEPAAGTETSEIRCPPGAIEAIVGQLGAGGDSLTVAAGTEVRIGARIEGHLRPLRGGPGADSLQGGVLADVLAGDRGTDRLLGKARDDLLRGGGGRDRLLGGGAADAIYGGAGADLLRGGAGPDLCRGGPGGDRFRSCVLIR